jgi:hypothetical protein
MSGFRPSTGSRIGDQLRFIWVARIAKSVRIRSFEISCSIDRVAALGNALRGFRYGDPVEGLSGRLESDCHFKLRNQGAQTIFCGKSGIAKS